MTRGQNIILGLASVVILGGLSLYISPIGQFITSYDNNEDKLKFDKKLWTINWDIHQIGENSRHYMLDDLLDNHLKIGMDSIKVKNLLGEPERDFGFSYNLGIYKSSFDPTFLILEFDDKGKLKDVNVETI
jgi:hypothetical protein